MWGHGLHSQTRTAYILIVLRHYSVQLMWQTVCSNRESQLLSCESGGGLFKSAMYLLRAKPRYFGVWVGTPKVTFLLKQNRTSAFPPKSSNPINC